MNKKQLIIAGILAAVGAGVGVQTAINNAARDNQTTEKSIRADLSDAVVDAAVILKGMRKNKEEIKQQIATDSGVQVSDIDGAVESTIGQANRSIRSKHSVPLVVVCDQSQLSQCFSAYARAYCEPLLKGAQEPQIFKDCLQINSIDQGAEYCTPGTQTKQKRVLKLNGTEPMQERFVRNAGQYEVFNQSEIAVRLAAFELCTGEGMP